MVRIRIVNLVFAISATCFDTLSNHNRYFFTLHKYNHSNREFIACQPSDTYSALQPATSLPLATIFVGRKVWLQFDFYVLLTVHLSIFILVINQLDAKNLFYNKFI